MKRLLMMIGAAAIVAMADVALATDLDGYRFRYDFSSGKPVFHGSEMQENDVISSWTYSPVYGLGGESSAVHPTCWGPFDDATALSSDWTLAMNVSPGSTEYGVFFSMGRMGKNNKRLVFCSSSEPGKIKVEIDYTEGSTRKHEKEIILDVGDASGFHSFVVVHHAASDNRGTLEFYWDGEYISSYLTTATKPIGDSNGMPAIQFCHQVSASASDPMSSSYKDSPDAAFKDFRLYPAALGSADARRYAALFPKSKLRQSAYLQSYGVNSINTGYLPKHTMRIAADFQFTAVTKQDRLFGSSSGDLLCFFYIGSGIVFSRCLHDSGSGWGDIGIAAGTGRGFVALDGPDNSAKLYYNGVLTSTDCKGVPANDSTIPLAIFTQNNTETYAGANHADGYYSTALLYSLGIDEGGTPVHFFAPHKDEKLGACLKDIVTGELKGEAEASPSTALSYSDGFGSSADYKYENGKLYAKVYVDSVDTAQGTVSVSAGGAALTPETDGGYWVAYNTTLKLAATPANEYLFDGWAGDMRAVASGTASSATLAVKVDKALQFEARFTPSVIRHTNFAGDFAKRAQDFDVGDYVQDGLVAHFDGIRNAGADAPHSDSATTWANLVSGGAAATRQTIEYPFNSSWTNPGEWEDDCYVFRGKTFFELGDKLTLGKAATIQIIAAFTPNSSQAQWYPVPFGAIEKDEDTAVYFNENKSAATERGYLYFKLLDGTTHGSSAPLTAGARSSINAIYDAENVRASISCADGYRWQTAHTTDSVGAMSYAIGTGRNTDTANSKQRGARAFVGRVSSVRIYRDVLTEEELEWNRIVDDARFRGEMDADFVVAENARGLDGVEAPGEYMVNGSHTFTATNLTQGVFAWTPAGYRLERWDEDAQAWKFVSEGSGASYTYVNSKTNGKMRLSWIWEQTGAVKGGYEPDDYIQDGLILHFDGIRNAGAAAAHDDSAATWTNLGSLGSANNATLATLSSGAPSGAAAGEWNNDGYSLKGQEYFAIPSATLGGALTVQIAADYDPDDQIATYPAFFGQTKEDDDYFGIYFNRNKSAADDKKRPYFKLLNTDTHGAKSVWSGPFATAIYDGSSANGVSIGNAVLPEWQKRNPSGDVPAYTYAIGTVGKTDSTQKSIRMLVGTMKSVRVYNRVLSDFALTHNRAIDEVRYNGNVTIVNGAIGDTGTTGASSAADGCYEVSSGTWTVTAGPKKVEGVTYQPKLLVEDYLNGAWVARTTKPQWMNSFTADAEALGSGRIRLTWSWQYQRGLIISVY